MKTTLLLVTTLVVVPVLAAQNDSTQEHWRKQQVRDQVEQMRKAMREGRIVRHNVKVKVRLKNGNKINGIVRNGRFIEKHDGLDFVVTDERERAGLRLWYYNGTNSYIFLPHASIAHYKLGIKMTDREIQDLEQRLVAAEVRRREMEREMAEERRKRLLAGRNKDKKGPAAKASDEEEKYGRKLTDDERKLMALLEEYPPEKGWGEKKIKDLKLRRITIGVYPNKEEKKFEESFEDWNKAVALQKELDKNKPPSGAK